MERQQGEQYRVDLRRELPGRGQDDGGDVVPLRGLLPEDLGTQRQQESDALAAARRRLR